MDKTILTFNVPSDISEKAKTAGLLTDEAITEWLLKELKRQERIDKLFDVIDKLRALQPPLTQEEIESEIEAARNETKTPSLCQRNPSLFAL